MTTRAPGSKAKPKLVGEFPAAVFGMVAVDGGTHAHRIYLAPGGAGKADLGTAPEGQRRNAKKSARVIGNDNTAGRSVVWGDPRRVPDIIVTEGIETGAAVARALADNVKAGKMAVAAAITADGVEAFQPYPATWRITIAADRDEASKNGQPGSRRGEKAAREFGRRYHEKLEIAVALPGTPGYSIDWLDPCHGRRLGQRYSSRARGAGGRARPAASCLRPWQPPCAADPRPRTANRLRK